MKKVLISRLPYGSMITTKDVTYELVDKLNPRDSVKGGRTEMFRMYCCVEDPENERISYLDVNSL